MSNNDYYILMHEYFVNEKLVITGCCIENHEFTKYIYKKSLKTLILNTRNIQYLLINEINNYEYYPAYGYSKINNIVALNSNDKNKDYVKNIDVLWYGNICNSSFFSYRKLYINKIKIYCNKNGLCFKEYDNLYVDKDLILLNTKIVIHVPQLKNYHILSWAKIVELMSKKIFFIIEEN